jgi:phosphoglucomutase
MGYTKVHVVSEQEMPDGNFPTVPYPNPEDPKAFVLAMKLADQVGADIILGTDPDADRVGAVVKNDAGEYVVLSGNMTGTLLTEYVLSQRSAAGTLPDKATVISTIVSTDMTKAIAAAYGADYMEVLTGFKYRGEQIKNFEADGSHNYVFGFEESFGYLAGTHARDKDAVGAAMLICEMAAFYKEKGMTLYDGLRELYKKYGYYKEENISIAMAGLEGMANIQRIMAALRGNPIQTAGGLRVVESRDYKSSKAVANGVESRLTLPVSDVLYYVLEDGTWFCVRPSGTEPKIKIYFGAKDAAEAEAAAKLATVSADVKALINGIVK